MGKWARLCLEYYVEEVNLVGQELVFWHMLAREDRPSEMTHEFNAANSQGISVLRSTLGATRYL